MKALAEKRTYISAHTHTHTYLYKSHQILLQLIVNFLVCSILAPYKEGCINYEQFIHVFCHVDRRICRNKIAIVKEDVFQFNISTCSFGVYTLCIQCHDFTKFGIRFKKILSLLTTFLLDQNGRYVVVINTEENIHIFLLLFAGLQQMMMIMEMFILRMSRIAQLLTAFMKVLIRKGKYVNCFSYLTDPLFTSWDFKTRYVHITERQLKSDFK